MISQVFGEKRPFEVELHNPQQAAESFVESWTSSRNVNLELNPNGSDVSCRLAAGAAIAALWDYSCKLLEFQETFNAKRGPGQLPSVAFASDDYPAVLGPLKELQDVAQERLRVLSQRLPVEGGQAEAWLRETVGPIVARLIPEELNLADCVGSRSPTNIEPRHLAHTLLYEEGGREEGAIVDWENRAQFLNFSKQQLQDDPNLAPAALMVAVHRIKDFTRRLDDFFVANRFYPSADSMTAVEVQHMQQIALAVVPQYYRLFGAFEIAGAALRHPETGKLPEQLLGFAESHLKGDLMRAPFPRRVMERPENRDGAALTIELMLERMERPNLLRGSDPVGILLNETFLSSPLVVGHQNRIHALKLFIMHCFDDALNESPPRLARSVTYGGGPIEELVQLFRGQEFRDFVTRACKKLDVHETSFPPKPLFVVADFDPRAIELGQSKVEAALRDAGYTRWGEYVLFRHADINDDLSYIRDRMRLAKKGAVSFEKAAQESAKEGAEDKVLEDLVRNGGADIVLVPGVLDYFGDKLSREFLKMFAQMVREENGSVVCTYVSPGDTPRPLSGLQAQNTPLLQRLAAKVGTAALHGNSFPIVLEYILGWEIILRTIAGVQALHGDKSLQMEFSPNLTDERQLKGGDYAAFVEPSGTNVFAVARPHKSIPPQITT
jgi:hypothetical protein